jgi:uncharacterized membrane protein YdbT with pleckstrin-like domain
MDSELLEETDVWWGAYSGRKIVPDLVLCALLTAVLFGLAWYFREWYQNVVRYLVQLAMAVLWIAAGGRGIYRLISTGYRVTTRRLLYYRGLVRPVRRELALKDVHDVTVRQKGIDRLFNVGEIQIKTTDDSQPFVFEAVGNPKAVAKEIEKRIEPLKGRTRDAPN